MDPFGLAYLYDTRQFNDAYERAQVESCLTNGHNAVLDSVSSCNALASSGQVHICLIGSKLDRQMLVHLNATKPRLGADMLRWISSQLTS